METVKPQIVEEVETSDENGNPAVTRIKNAASAYQTMLDMIKSDEGRAKDRAKIKGMIDGQRPYSEKELAAKGMSWRSNVNWREAEGMIDASTGSYTELVMELAELIDVDILPESPVQDPDGDYAEIISEEYTRILTKWRKFIPNYNIMVGQFGRYGRGLYFWPDEYSWKYRTVKTANILLPENSEVTLEDMDLLMIRDSLSPVRIYNLINEPEASALAGWNIPALKRLMVHMYSSPAQKQTDDMIASEYENIASEIGKKNLGLDDDAFKNTPICYSLEKSLTDETVRMTIIQAAEEPSEYLFEKSAIYDDLYQAAALFVYNYAEGELHDVRGLGHRSFAHVEVSNRLLNGMVDAQQMMNSMIVTGNNKAVNDVLRISRLGPITVIPDSLQIVQQNFQPRMDGAIALRQLLHTSLNNNTGQSKNQAENGSVERVAAAVKYRAGKEAGFGRNQTMLFYSQWDCYHTEIIRRLLNPNYPTGWDGKEEADQFKRRCELRGVPTEVLNADMITVTARRAIGNGSPLDKDSSTKEMVSLANTMPERGAFNAMRDRGSFLVGATNVNRYFPKDKKGSPTNEHSIATLENNDMFEGTPVLVGNDQKHTIHNDIHLQKLVELAEVYKSEPQSVDVVVFAQYFAVAVEHTLQHNAVMESNPVLADDAEVYKETIKAMAKIRDELIRDAQAVMAERAKANEQMQNEAQAEQDPELRMKLERHALDMQIKADAAKNSIELKRQMQNHTIRTREIRDAHAMALQRNKG